MYRLTESLRESRFSVLNSSASWNMGQEWSWQIRIFLPEELAETAREDPGSSALERLPAILMEHRATMKCQLDAFADFVAEAEKQGADNSPLYRWTKATIEDPEKKAKYLKSFTLYVDGQEVYEQEKADALEMALRPLVNDKLISRMSKHDTNPANNPQPPERFKTA